MTIRLNKVTRELNVGITTIADFLQKKGYTVDANPNAKISDEEYALLVSEFNKDKNVKQGAEQMLQDKRNQKSQKKAVTAAAKADAKSKHAQTPTEESRQKYNPIGKIDLDALDGKKQQAKPAEPAAKSTNNKEPEVLVATPAPEAPKVVEAPIKSPVQEVVVSPEVSPEIKKTKKAYVKTVDSVHNTEKKSVEQPVEQPVEKPVEEKISGSKADNITNEAKPTVQETNNEPKKEQGSINEEGVFSLHGDEEKPKLKVLGTIDLDTLNQNTRPKRKTKEERKKEREQKERQRQEHRKQMKDSILKDIRKDGDTSSEGNASSTRKRKRVNTEKVDVTKERGTNARGGNANNANNNKRGGNQNANNQQGGARANNNRRNNNNKRNQPKQEVTETDVAKQVKETLARLTSKSKGGKGAKYRKEKRKHEQDRQQAMADQAAAESKVLKLTEFVTVSELATMMDVGVTDVISTCMSIGMMVSINMRLDAETINMVAEEFGYTTEYVSAQVASAIEEEEDKVEDLQPRAPIVTVMGHVDHGKTSLLDYIRSANVIAGEAGGITQHIGAYNVTLEDGKRITFLDTPGHEAFTAMRARGTQVTDIAIIIVAADDSVMPQTREAINHAQAAGVPIVFAINKVDKSTANPEKIKQELAEMNYLVEDWGGKYQSQDISAKQGTGVQELLEKVLLEAEMLDLKANPNRKATGSIIESTLDKGRGYVATMLVSNGTLNQADIVLAGTHHGRIKAMFNERNQRIEKAGPSEPVLILGLDGAPTAGDTFHVMSTEQEAREVANQREQLQREQGLRTQKNLTLDEIGRRIALGNFQELNLIVKGDVDGSIEALSDALIKQSTEQIQVNVIHKAVGQISESDVTLAAASDAIIIGFQVRPSAAARRYAETEGVDIRMYSVIYAAIEEVKSAMEGMLAPEIKEEVTSTIEVREVFHITKVGTVAGAMVREGKVKRSDKARLIREGVVIHTGEINALKRFKDDVKEVATNYECGISLVNYHDIKVDDVIETFEEVEVAAKLK
ncbi:MAG TPA: translation initiation factor IF-2 [Bacteroidaceae bacterium]|nr:translation initiation factor IF-2 [Bacteroidaceae bacterium]